MIGLSERVKVIVGPTLNKLYLRHWFVFNYKAIIQVREIKNNLKVTAVQNLKKNYFKENKKHMHIELNAW